MSLAHSDRDYAVRRPTLPRPEILESSTEPAAVYVWRTLPAQVAEPSFWRAAVTERVAELSQLGPNWDGRGSAAVKSDVVKFAEHLLSGVMVARTFAPSIIPMGDGGLQLVWLNGGAELDVEISAPPQILVTFEDASGRENEFPADTDYSQLQVILKQTFTR